MTHKEVMQQALETLEALSAAENIIWVQQRAEIEVEHLRTALAQPEQEPVAYYHPHKGFYWAKPTHISTPTAMDVPPVPLYVKWKAAQRPWQGLTDEEVAIASAEFDTKLKLAFHAGMYKAQIILRKKNDPTY